MGFLIILFCYFKKNRASRVLLLLERGSWEGALFFSVLMHFSLCSVSCAFLPYVMENFRLFLSVLLHGHRR